MIYVQFSDENKKTVVSVFSSPQNPETYPNYDEIDDDDERYIAFASSSKSPFFS